MTSVIPPIGLGALPPTGPPPPPPTPKRRAPRPKKPKARLYRAGQWMGAHRRLTLASAALSVLVICTVGLAYQHSHNQSVGGTDSTLVATESEPEEVQEEVSPEPTAVVQAQPKDTGYTSCDEYATKHLAGLWGRADTLWLEKKTEEEVAATVANPTSPTPPRVLAIYVKRWGDDQPTSSTARCE